MLTTTLIRGYPVITVYDRSISLCRPLQRIDLRSVSARDLADLSLFSERPTATVYAAQDPLEHLPRTEQGTIKHGSWVRLTSSQLRAIREALVGRPHRHVSEISLSNLRPAPRFTSESRPNKPRRYTSEMVQEAQDLKASGLSWSEVGQRMNANPRGLQAACRAQPSI